MKTAGFLLIIAPLLAGETFAAGDPQRGAAAFRQCAACHSMEPGRHLTGPSLAAAWGRKAGTAEGFRRYSRALKQADLTWDEGTLDAWLKSPQQLVPGNAMNFPGVGDSRRRADLIAYLRAAAEGKAPAAPEGGMMMGRATRPNLRDVEPAYRVKAIRHCGDGYWVTTADGATYTFWEFNLRFKTDSSAEGPPPGSPALLGAGMAGDRASVVFAGPGEISAAIRPECP